uniref:Clathrin light chain n=1 Tax=Panagrolaimus sp. JU765 TaxID=591449 RepID=A0AC34QFT5_9BILA
MADPVASFLEREQGIFGDLDGTAADVPTINEPFPETNGVGVLNDDFPATNLNGINGISSVVSNGAEARTISPAASEKSENEPVFQSKPDFEPDSVYKWREGYERNLKKLGELYFYFEPDSVYKWREGYERNLKKLDADEEKMVEDLKLQAKKELEEFEKKRQADLEKRKKENREKQKEFLKNVEKASAGILWQRIAKVVEEDEKTPKNIVDTDRMRELLLQCKDGGPKPTSD